MAQSLNQFLDALSDDELEFLDTDPDFFNEVKTKFATPSQPPQTLLEKTGSLAQDITAKGRELLSPLQKLLQPATEQIGQGAETLFEQLPGIAKAPFQALGTGLETFERGGEAVAETLAGPGVAPKPLVQDPVLSTLLGPFNPPVPQAAEEGDIALKTSPEVAALIGTGFQMTPEILATLASPGVLPAFKSVFSKQGAKQSGQFLTNLVKRGPKPVKDPALGGRVFGPNVEEAKQIAASKTRQFEPRAAKAEEILAAEDIGRVEEKISRLKLKQAELPLKKQAKDIKRVERLEKRSQREIGRKKQEELTFREKLQGLPEEQKAKLRAREGQVRELGEDIGKAETAAKIPRTVSKPISTLARNPKELDALAASFEKHPSVSKVSNRGLQIRRKLAEQSDSLPVSPETRKVIRQSGRAATTELEKRHPTFQATRKAFKVAADKVDQIPEEFAGKRRALGKALGKTKVAIAEEKATYDRLLKQVKENVAQGASTAEKKKAVKLTQAIERRKAQVNKVKQEHKGLARTAKEADADSLARIESKNDTIITAAQKRAKRQKVILLGVLALGGFKTLGFLAGAAGN